MKKDHRAKRAAANLSDRSGKPKVIAQIEPFYSKLKPKKKGDYREAKGALNPANKPKVKYVPRS